MLNYVLVLIVPFIFIFTVNMGQEKKTKRPKIESTTMSLAEFMKQKDNQLAEEYHYNPNYGYESYWPGGDWVFDHPDKGKNISTTKIPLVCGDECNYLYTRIGNVCAHRADNTASKGCWAFMWGTWCSGKRIDDQTEGFTTFETYCKFLDAQCRADFSESWVLVHVGECNSNQSDVFKPIQHESEPVSRMKSYLSTLARVLDNL